MAKLKYPTKGLIDSYFNARFAVDESTLGSTYQNPNGSFSLHNRRSIASLPVLPNPRIIGIDLPVLVESTSDNKDVVVILGQSPARDPHCSKVVTLNPMLPDDVIIGTPYAVHFPNSYKGVKVYHDVVDYILNEDCNVYLTDILKFHTNRLTKANKVKNDFATYYKDNIKADALRLLNDEINALRSMGYSIKAVVLWGNMAQSLAGLFHGIPIVNTLHPSPSANGY